MAGFQQMTSTRVSQAVRAVSFRWQSNDGKVSLHEVMKCPIRQGSVWGAQGQEECVALALWPTVAQVAYNSVADPRLKGEGLKQ